MPKKLMLTLVAATILLGASAASAQPRPDKSWKSWFGHADLSFALAQGEAGKVLEDMGSLRKEASGGKAKTAEGESA